MSVCKISLEIQIKTGRGIRTIGHIYHVFCVVQNNIKHAYILEGNKMTHNNLDLTFISKVWCLISMYIKITNHSYPNLGTEVNIGQIIILDKNIAEKVYLEYFIENCIKRSNTVTSAQPR